MSSFLQNWQVDLTYIYIMYMYIYFTKPFDIGQPLLCSCLKCRLANHCIWGQRPTHADINSKIINTENKKPKGEGGKKESLYFDHSSPAVGMQ